MLLLCLLSFVKIAYFSLFNVLPGDGCCALCYTCTFLATAFAFCDDWSAVIPKLDCPASKFKLLFRMFKSFTDIFC